MHDNIEHIAVISDIHGNLTALERVLADCRARGVSAIYNLGDLAGKGPDGPEVIDLCRQVCDVNIFGNWDDLMLREETQSASVQWHRQRLGPEPLPMPLHRCALRFLSQHQVIPIAEDVDIADLAAQIDDLGPVRAFARQIAQIVNGRDAAGAAIGQHPFQRRQIAVDIGDDGDVFDVIVQNSSPSALFEGDFPVDFQFIQNPHDHRVHRAVFGDVGLAGRAALSQDHQLTHARAH